MVSFFTSILQDIVQEIRVTTSYAHCTDLSIQLRNIAIKDVNNYIKLSLFEPTNIL